MLGEGREAHRANLRPPRWRASADWVMLGA